MPYYKKTTTQLKHDTARSQHIRDIEYLKSVWNDTHDYKILNKIILYEDQLLLYDRIMGYDKINSDY